MNFKKIILYNSQNEVLTTLNFVKLVEDFSLLNNKPTTKLTFMGLNIDNTNNIESILTAISNTTKIDYIVNLNGKQTKENLNSYDFKLLRDPVINEYSLEITI